MIKESTPWYVDVVKSAGKTFYQVKRITVAEGNPMATRTEKRGGYYDYFEDASRLAEKLNAEEAKK